MGEAYTMRGILTLKYPIERGVITNWDDMERFWHHIFYNELRVAPEEHPVICTHAPLTPKANREKMTQIMFETFCVPAFYCTTDAQLAALSQRMSTGLVLQSGDGATNAVPIHQNHVIEDAVLRLDLAGRDITNYLMKLLTDERGCSFTTSVEREMVAAIKNDTCFVVQDFDEAMEVSGMMSSSLYDTTIELPDGSLLRLGNERFRCAEAMFKPSLVGMEAPGVHEMIHSAIQKCSADLRHIMYSNILLTGGNTAFPGFAIRLRKEVEALAPAEYNVEVIAPPERKYGEWIGGSILGALPPAFLKNMWITKEEYDEYGPTIVNSKCQ